MGLLGKFLDKKIQDAIVAQEASMRSNINVQTKNSNALKNFLIKTMGYLNSVNVGRDKPAPPEYDFEEIKRAIETDSYIKGSLDKYRRLVFKAGYFFKSNNPSTTEYLWQRFKVMDYATRKPIDVLFQEISDDMISYSNCFLVKTRVKQVMPGINAKGLYGLDPIGAYSRIDPSTISIVRDDHGNVVRYEQKVMSGKEKKYKPEDIIHIYMDKDPNNAFGTPKIIAAMEDVKVLRRLEGNILAIVHRFAMPIFQWKIGLPEVGFQASDPEIQQAKDEIENMSVDGVVITNEKTDIKVIGAEGNAINAGEYLKYFEARVFSALDTSAAAMGRGGAKQDADSMEAHAHDYVKYVQKVLKIFIENYMLYELLLEGGFNPILNSDDEVSMEFNEISLETKTKLENHEMLKFQSNVLTFEEVRRNLGIDEEVDESRLYKFMIEVPAQEEVAQVTADAQGEWSMDIAKVGAAARAASASGKTTATNGKKKSQKPSKAVSTKNRPSNQHGTTSVKMKEEVNLVESVVRDKNKHKKKYSAFYDKLNLLSSNLHETDTDIEYLMSISLESLSLIMNELIDLSAREGLDIAKIDLDKLEMDSNNIATIKLALDRFKEQSRKDIKGILKDIKTRLKDNREFEQVDAVINALEYRFRCMLEGILPKVVWYSYLVAGKACGVERAVIDFGDSSDADKHEEEINLKAYSLDDIPAFHPFCDCKVKFEK